MRPLLLTRSPAPPSVFGNELWQIFITDPNGVVIELNYETAKEGL